VIERITACVGPLLPCCLTDTFFSDRPYFVYWPASCDEGDCLGFALRLGRIASSGECAMAETSAEVVSAPD
jgi:hypothetical protein